MRKNNRQEVTGIVVNAKPSVSKKKLHRFRALLHNILLNGWQNQKWGTANNLIHAIEGYINFIKMVDVVKAEKYQNKLKEIIAKHGYPELKGEPRLIPSAKIENAPQIIETTPTVEIPKYTQPENDKNWWNIF